MIKSRPVRGTTEHQQMRRRQWGCIGGLLGLLATLLLGAGYVYLFRSVPLRISKETTYITGPLKSDGKRVDYFAAWEQETYPANIATEENSYRLIVQHLGMAPEATPAHFAQLCKTLGLDAESIHPDMTLTDTGEFLAAYVAGEDFDEAMVERLIDAETGGGALLDPIALRRIGAIRKWTLDDLPKVEAWLAENGPVINALQNRLDAPWTLDDLPMMEAWLAESGPAIDLIGETVQKPTFHVPIVRQSEDDLLTDYQLLEISQTRLFARAIGARANHRIATGDIDGAIEDMVLCKALGRRVGHGGPLTQLLVGLGIEGISNMLGIAGSLEHPPTKRQLERLVDELNDLPAQADLEQALLFDRYQALDVIQAIATGKCALEELDLPREMSSKFALDWNVFARRFNEHSDRMTMADYTIPSWTLMASISVRARSERMADLFTNNMPPNGVGGREGVRRSTCAGRLQRMTLAMLLYECDHGTLPPAYTVDGDGNPLHSWRVLLLPYLDQQELHDKIRLEEPWNSDHNRQFHKQAVAFYQCPSAGLAPGNTTYTVVVGPDMPFEAGQGKKLADFGVNMVLIVEGTASVCWMDPMHNISQAEAEEGINGFLGAGAAIGSQHPGGVEVGYRDGSNNFISETIDLEHLKALLRGTASTLP